jgi:hypothetical protein
MRKKNTGGPGKKDQKAKARIKRGGEEPRRPTERRKKPDQSQQK